MAVIDVHTDDRYWVVTDSDPREDGKFDLNLKQVADYQGNPAPIRPAARITVIRNQDVPRGTIIKVTTTVTTDRIITPNPTA